MQDLGFIALILRDISIGILFVGLFYTFGMFLLGRLFSVISEHGETEHDVEKDFDHHVEHDIEKDFDHDVDHDYDHDIDHDYEHDVDHDYDHDVEHDYEKDFDHDVEHDYEKDFDHEHGYDTDIGHSVEKDFDHDVDHDIEKDFDHHVEHDVEKDMDHHVEKDIEHGPGHDVDVDHDVEKDHSGFFETERGAPLGVTIGTSLVSFGFIGAIIYYEGIMIPLGFKVLAQFISVVLVVYAVRTVLGKVFVEAGFNITPRHIVGMEVEAASTVRDDFGEVRAETEMGLRRFHARPFQKGVVFQKGSPLFVISADDKFVYVDPRKEVSTWLKKQTSKKKEK